MAQSSSSAGPGRQTPDRSWGVARFLAPLGLIVVLIAAFAVASGSLGIDDEDPSAGEGIARTSESDGGEGDGPENPKTYVVESGDVLSSIAEKFDVSVDRLVRLNPDVDPQTLNAGTEIKIR